MQLFRRSANFMMLWIPLALILAGGIIAGSWYGMIRSAPLMPPAHGVEQPVPFSHLTHAGRLQIDCRYCHTSVETSHFAGIPSIQTCMTCHSQIWRNSPVLQPVRTSWESGRPLQWNRVYNLPDHAWFDHSIHVTKGYGCSSCHGAVDQMSQIWQVRPLHMRWCVDCHRHPERHVRPPERIYDMEWEPRDEVTPEAVELLRFYGTDKRRLTDCTACHR
jgi:hypothetical protein